MFISGFRNFAVHFPFASCIASGVQVLTFSFFSRVGIPHRIPNGERLHELHFIGSHFVHRSLSFDSFLTAYDTYAIDAIMSALGLLPLIRLRLRACCWSRSSRSLRGRHLVPFLPAALLPPLAAVGRLASLMRNNSTQSCRLGLSRC
jgi:hypothetical protein